MAAHIDENEAMFTVGESSKLSRMSESWWRQKIFLRQVRHVKIGSRVFIPRSTISEIIRKGIVEPRVDRKPSGK
jgi:hypothetical protein